MLTNILQLMETWRHEAELYRRRGNDEDAHFLESLVCELNDVVAGFFEECVPPIEAAQRSGYSVVHLRRLIERGDLRTADSADGVRVYVCDLPAHPRKLPAILGITPPDRLEDGPVELHEARLRARRNALRRLA